MSARSRGSAAVALAVAASLALGCGAFTRRPLEKQRFVLTPGVPAAHAGPPIATVLRVDLVRGSQLVANRGFLYQTSADTLTSDFYNELFAPPAVLVRDALLEWLRASGRFAAVVRGSKARPQWILESDLETFLADLRDPAVPSARLELAVRLLDARADDARLVFARRYAEREPAASHEPAALVEAWSRALARALAAIESDTGAAVAAAATRR
jgi:ABC-type uncharacterized transport system auxiliary subunit